MNITIMMGKRVFGFSLPGRDYLTLKQYSREPRPVLGCSFATSIITNFSSIEKHLVYEIDGDG